MAYQDKYAEGNAGDDEEEGLFKEKHVNRERDCCYNRGNGNDTRDEKDQDPGNEDKNQDQAQVYYLNCQA